MQPAALPEQGFRLTSEAMVFRQKSTWKTKRVHPIAKLRIVDRKDSQTRRSTVMNSLPHRQVSQAMQACDDYVLEIIYRNSRGERTQRTISPVRFLDRDRFLALCLCREEPRQFSLRRCEKIRLIPACDVQMPVPIVELATTHETVDAGGNATTATSSSIPNCIGNPISSTTVSVAR